MKFNILEAVSVIGVGVLLGATIGAAESGVKGAIAYGLFAVVMGLVVVSKD